MARGEGRHQALSLQFGCSYFPSHGEGRHQALPLR